MNQIKIFAWCCPMDATKDAVVAVILSQYWFWGVEDKEEPYQLAGVWLTAVIQYIHADTGISVWLVCHPLLCVKYGCTSVCQCSIVLRCMNVPAYMEYFAPLVTSQYNFWHSTSTTSYTDTTVAVWHFSTSSTSVI